MRAVTTGAGLLGLMLLAAIPASADNLGAPASIAGAPAPVSVVGTQASGASQEAAPAQPAVTPKAPPMIMNLLSRPMESQESAFRESIKQAVRSADSRDGAIRIGGATLSIVVKDACPDGEMYHDMDLVQRPRPGRTRR
jgi:hypothetical protein